MSFPALFPYHFVTLPFVSALNAHLNFVNFVIYLGTIEIAKETTTCITSWTTKTETRSACY